MRLDHANWSGSGHCRFLWLPEGVIGRVDDMVTIRGLNIFPSGIERLVRSIPSISEYQVEVSRQGELDQLLLRVEADQAGALELEKLLSTRLGLRVPKAARRRAVCRAVKPNPGGGLIGGLAEGLAGADHHGVERRGELVQS